MDIRSAEIAFKGPPFVNISQGHQTAWAIANPVGTAADCGLNAVDLPVEGAEPVKAALASPDDSDTAGRD